MKKLAVVLSVGLGSFLAISSADAADCGSAASPSTNAACTCPAGVRSGTFTRTFKKVSLNISSECGAAASAAKANCSKYGAVKTFNWQKVSSHVKNILGYKTGNCVIKYTCTYTRYKKSALRVSNTLGTANGWSEKKLTTVSVNLNSAYNAVKGQAMSYCNSKFGHAVSLKVTKYQCKTINVLGIKHSNCKIWWTCTFKKRYTVYWCQ